MKEDSNHYSEVMKAMVELQKDLITHNQQFIDKIIEAKIEATQEAFKRFAEKEGVIL